MAGRTALTKPRISLDRSIDRMRKQLSELTPYLRNGKAVLSLEEFDMETERLIADLLGETSEMVDAYEYAELGEAAGLVERVSMSTGLRLEGGSVVPSPPAFRMRPVAQA